jgi:hypothetical protein
LQKVQCLGFKNGIFPAKVPYLDCLGDLDTFIDLKPNWSLSYTNKELCSPGIYALFDKSPPPATLDELIVDLAVEAF